MKFELKNLEIRFHKCQASFLVVKTVKCKRALKHSLWQNGTAYPPKNYDYVRFAFPKFLLQKNKKLYNNFLLTENRLSHVNDHKKAFFMNNLSVVERCLK